MEIARLPTLDPSHPPQELLAVLRSYSLETPITPVVPNSDARAKPWESTAGDVRLAGGQIFSADEMPSLKALMTHVVAVQRISVITTAIGARERLVWICLTMLGLVWGVVTGLTFAGEFPLEPLTGVIGSLGVIVLAVTVNVHGRQRSST